MPATIEELKALTERIAADGGTLWCIGLGSGGATGWPATDWVEDMLLRTALRTIPTETIEAAVLDGAGPVQIFLHGMVPQIRGTILVVWTTITLTVLKVFDIVLATQRPMAIKRLGQPDV